MQAGSQFHTRVERTEIAYVWEMGVHGKMGGPCEEPAASLTSSGLFLQTKAGIQTSELHKERFVWKVC